MEALRKNSRIVLVCSAVAFCCALAIAAQHPAEKSGKLMLGSAWYPEQWPESRWEADLALMEAAHMNVVRIGEFAWSALEPAEGKYELDWMDHAIALAAKHHLAVVLGTPTDAPPAWLTAKYPETLGVNADGRAREHGNRRQFNYASPKYRALCRDVVAAMAKRFGRNPNVIGWQIGNEYTDESFDPATRKQFQEFLHQRYGTLDALNQRWSTAYWSQAYSDWSQIPMETTRGNPGLLLEHKHFVTATWCSFQREQIETLRPLIVAGQFITTNIGGLAWSDNWDHYAVSRDLDLVSWDDYVGQGHLDTTKNAMLNDFVRGWRRQNFWVMETQPGSVNWAPINNALDPGEVRALAWQTVGHGADAVLYWQWRAALNGQEQYHGAIVGTDGTPLPLYQEIAQLGREFQVASKALAGTSPQSETGILHTYDSRWAIDFQPHSRRYDQQQVLLQFYATLSALAQAAGEQVDMIDPTQGAPLDQYKLLVAPSLNVLSQALADKLLAWVRAGGHLLLGPRSGMKDEYNALQPQRQPGPLATALGARVEQFYALASAVDLQGGGNADIWAEPLDVRANDVRIDLRFAATGAGWLNGKPAMVTRKEGKGTISYLGTLPDEGTMSRLVANAASEAGVSGKRFTLPHDVELCVRIRPGQRGAGSEVLLFINHGEAAQTVTLPGRFRSVLEGKSGMTALELPSQGVDVLTEEGVR